MDYEKEIERIKRLKNNGFKRINQVNKQYHFKEISYEEFCKELASIVSHTIDELYAATASCGD